MVPNETLAGKRGSPKNAVSSFLRPSRDLIQRILLSKEVDRARTSERDPSPPYTKGGRKEKHTMGMRETGAARVFQNAL